ncbi:hypothetical protein MTO96_052294 [Rhipicephalus appendiculatus]
MALVREFGDPHVLTLAEVHILLRLELPWPRGAALPKGISLWDDDDQLLNGNQESLVSAVKSTLPRKAKISKALFCGCASFDFSLRSANATMKLLRDTQEICIVHNRNKVYKLVRMFPNAKVLALVHDLCDHFLEFEEPWRDPSAPLVQRCQLRKLVGNLMSNPEGCLLISYKTTLALLHTCPHISRIDSVTLAGCFMEPHRLPISTELPKAKHFTHLWLFSWQRVSNQLGPTPVKVANVTLAANTFPAGRNPEEDPKIEPSSTQEPRREGAAKGNLVKDATRPQAEAEVLEKVKQETPTDTVPDGKTCRAGEVATKQPPSLVSEKLTKLVGQTQCRVVPELVKHQQHTSERDDDMS